MHCTCKSCYAFHPASNTNFDDHKQGEIKPLTAVKTLRMW